MLGLGPLEPLLADPTISDILVNGSSQVYVERRGQLSLTEVTFADDDHLMKIIDKIVSRVGRRVDESSPMADARLPDGSRVNVIIPPLALDGPVMSIRRFSVVPLTMANLIEFKTLTAEMAEVLQALSNAEVNLLISGGTGSGKTTLLNIMGGLDRPTSGRLLFRDLDLTDLEDRELTKYRRDHVGFVFQFYNLVPSLTAYENVALVTEVARNPMRPADALALVGLEERMHHFPAQLSGGEQQRVAIARAIAKRPAVLLCDEPTGALDSKTGIRVIEALLGVNRQLGTTTVIITHNASIQQVADRVLFFADGRISRIQKNETRREAAELIW
jgi:putative ABC transport system ATP-binding protein